LQEKLSKSFKILAFKDQGNEGFPEIDLGISDFSLRNSSLAGAKNASIHIARANN
jgi:hypothetical protein